MFKAFIHFLIVLINFLHQIFLKFHHIKTSLKFKVKQKVYLTFNFLKVLNFSAHKSKGKNKLSNVFRLCKLIFLVKKSSKKFALYFLLLSALTFLQYGLVEEQTFRCKLCVRIDNSAPDLNALPFQVVFLFFVADCSTFIFILQFAFFSFSLSKLYKNFSSFEIRPWMVRSEKMNRRIKSC